MYDAHVACHCRPCLFLCVADECLACLYQQTGGYYKPSDKPDASNKDEDKSKAAPNTEIKPPTTTASMVPYALKKKQQAAKGKNPAGSDDDEDDDDGAHGSSFLQSCV